MKVARGYLTVSLFAGLWVTGGAADRPAKPSDADVVEWVNQHVRERQPTKDERRFDEIGWATDLRTAIRLGKEFNRPIFLFTMDGWINTGRC
jgi:hypothetical protein